MVEERAELSSEIVESSTMVNYKTVVIIQARLGSTRLPGKVLLEIEGIPVLVHIVERLRKASNIDKIIVATSDLPINNKILEVCKKHKIDFFVGDEENVLKRFYDAAKKYSAKNIVRITADCPLVDNALVDKLIVHYKINNYDYCGIATGAGVAGKKDISRFPDGLDAEIFSFNVLEKAYVSAKSKLQKEHVTPYIWQNPTMFNLGLLQSEFDYSNYRLTLDNAEDLILIKWIYAELYWANANFNLKDIITILESNSQILSRNKHLIGKEGYEDFR